MAIELIIGIGICAFLLLFFAFKWDKQEHVILHLLTSFFFLILLFLIPTVIISDPADCEIVVMNETILGNVTTFSYGSYCATVTSNTHTIFYKVILWFLKLFCTYIFVYLCWHFFIKKKLLDWKFLKKKPGKRI